MHSRWGISFRSIDVKTDCFSGSSLCISFHLLYVLELLKNYKEEGILYIFGLFNTTQKGISVF